MFPDYSCNITLVILGCLGVQTKVLQPSNKDFITTADSGVFSSRDFPQRMTLQIPAEFIGGKDECEVRVVAAVYYNVGDLLPESRPGRNE